MFSLYDKCAKYFELNAGHYLNTTKYFVILVPKIMQTRQVTRATHVRNRICPRVKLIIKIIIILLIIFLGFKSKSC